jgi:hypothetical protein
MGSPLDFRASRASDPFGRERPKEAIPATLRKSLLAIEAM